MLDQGQLDEIFLCVHHRWRTPVWSKREMIKKDKMTTRTEKGKTVESRNISINTYSTEVFAASCTFFSFSSNMSEGLSAECSQTMSVSQIWCLKSFEILIILHPPTDLRTDLVKKPLLVTSNYFHNLKQLFPCYLLLTWKPENLSCKIGKRTRRGPDGRRARSLPAWLVPRLI